MERQRVAVIGAGAVGGVFAAHLSGGHDVVACVRRPFDQWVIESPEVPFDGPAQAVTDPEQLPWTEPADVVLVALKAQHTDGASAWFAPLCGPDTLVVSVQNGIEGVERLSPLAPSSDVISSVVYCGAELIGPGHINHSFSARLIVPDNVHGRRLADLAVGTPLDIDPSADHDVAAWIKLGINSVANGLTALTGKPMGVINAPGVRQIGEQLVTECWTVGRAAGVDLRLDTVDDLIDRMAAGNPTGRTSMLHDRESGRPTEVDAIHGAVLRAAHRHDVPTPITRIVHDLIRAGDPD